MKSIEVDVAINFIKEEVESFFNNLDPNIGYDEDRTIGFRYNKYEKI